MNPVFYLMIIVVTCIVWAIIWSVICLITKTLNKKYDELIKEIKEENKFVDHMNEAYESKFSNTAFENDEFYLCKKNDKMEAFDFVNGKKLFELKNIKMEDNKDE